MSSLHGRRLIILVSALAVALSACASRPEEKGEAEEKPLTVEEVLATTLGEEAYGNVERCLPQHAYDRTEVLDQQHILFWGRGGKAWLNTLSAKCPGLRKRDTLTFELTQSQLCRMDTVSSVDYGIFGVQRVSGRCALGDFVEIGEEQAKLLKEQLEER